MGDILRWVASDSVVPRHSVLRQGAPVDFSNASLIGIQYRQIVASGVTPVTASYLATIAASAADGSIDVRNFASAPLATAGQYRAQVKITSASGVETIQMPFTVVLSERF